MNTSITYEYRDGANYRFHGTVIVSGEMTCALWTRVRGALDRESDGGFIAHQVAVPEVFGFLPGPHIVSGEHEHTGYPYDEETDHCWHRFGTGPDCWELTSDPTTDKRTVEELVDAFETAAADGWRVFDPGERFDL